jgi:hypothetical protein
MLMPTEIIAEPPLQLTFRKVLKSQEEIMSDKSSSSSGGIGFCGLLTIVFITLKLLGKITWSWWWVLSPLWIGFVAFVFILVVIFTIAMITT